MNNQTPKPQAPETLSASERLTPVDRIKAAIRSHPRFAQGQGQVHIARAPGRLDVMGGIADYTGSRVCQMTLDIAAAAAVQTRNDGLVICMSQQHTDQSDFVMQASELASLAPLALRKRIGSEHAWAGYIVGCLAWLMKHHPQPAMLDGATLMIDSDVPAGGGVSSSAAIEVATMSALVSLYELQLSPMQIAAGCQNVENEVVGAPCGVMDQVVSCMGSKNAILQILCQSAPDGMPAQVQGLLPVPNGFAFVGVHSGVRHEVRGDPYGDTRVAAFMAHKIIRSQSVPHQNLDHLANISLVDYEQTLRNLLPATLTGKAFVDAYGSTGDTATTINHDRLYHIQDAADHHVREMHRVTQFAQLLKQQDAQSTSNDDATTQAMTKAGQLMNESHQSYTQCARLGHPMTDLLASMFREAGPACGLYGNRVTGGGCGGTLAVLVRDEARSYQTIDQIRQRYESDTGRATMLFTGTSDGAAHCPVIILPHPTSQKGKS